ncbi:MAG TPA: hypothetical protein VGI92_00555 [Gemmatimonadales bacterium]|jgi:hypothetical protein
MISAHSHDSGVQPDLVRTFRARSSRDGPLIVGGNGVVLLIVISMYHDDVPGLLLWYWAAAILAATLVRAVWHHRGKRADVSDARFVAGVRLVAAAQGLTWGIGAALLMRWLPARELAIHLAGLAGIMASALNTLAADSRSFRYLVLGISLPLPIGMIAVGLDGPHIEVAVLVIVFALAMLLVHRQVHGALVEHLRTVARLILSEKHQGVLISELQRTIAEVRTLTGLLPICASCKKVRDDGGYWRSVEAYVTEHTDAQFSHGVCPECFPKLYPDIPYPIEAPN